MRHRKATNNFSRKPPHRKAMIRNMIVSLFKQERITTTLQKAKAARRLAEKLITLGRKGTLEGRRRAYQILASKPAVSKLFRILGPRFKERPGGYTRIVRLPATIRVTEDDASHGFKPHGRRLGDQVEQVVLELVEAEMPERAST